MPRLASAIIVLLLVSACGGPSGPPAGPTLPVVTGVREVGLVENPTLPDVRRGGGASGRVDGRMLWTFGDTTIGAATLDPDRSSSAAYAEISSPTVLSEPLDAGGAPVPLLPLDAEERAANQAGGGERIALWPTAVIPFGENGYVLYRRVRVGAAGPPETLSTGLAYVKQGATVGERSPEIFVAPEPPFHHAALLDHGLLKLFACDDATRRCKVARAPFEQATDRAAYEFWTGTDWSPDVARAAAVVPGSTTGLSIVYNTYLEAFVALESRPGSGRVVLRTASAPEGPWGEDVEVYDVGAAIEATVQHVELTLEAGRRFSFSYCRDGEVHLVEVTLR